MSQSHRTIEKRIVIENYDDGVLRQRMTQELFSKGDIKRCNTLERFDRQGEIRTVQTEQNFRGGHQTTLYEGYVGGTICVKTSIVGDGKRMLHSVDDQPSSIELWPTGAKRILYTKNNLAHRDGGKPAYIHVDDHGNTEQHYYVDGELSRPDNLPVVEKIKRPQLPGFKPD